MAAPRKPTNVLELSGAFKHDPQRARPDEPDGKGDFPADPPFHLDSKQAECWREIADACPAGVLTGSDGHIVEMTAILLADFRERGASMENGKLGRLSILLGRLGMDPSGRAGLKVDKRRENPFSDF